MFTGIVEEIGRVRSIRSNGPSVVLEIEASAIFDDLKLGDSVAVNGVCLTATSIGKRSFTADVMHETLNRSSLGSLGVGGSVNLERAMPAYGRFGGHIVSGHIDGVGKIVSLENDANAVWYKVFAPAAIMRYVVEKGSIAIDGISLTVAKVTADTFSVSIIPHTFAQTVLAEKRVGDVVNLENDIVAKYVEKMLANPGGAVDGVGGGVGFGGPSGSKGPGGPGGSGGAGGSGGGISAGFLAENGFL